MATHAVAKNEEFQPDGSAFGGSLGTEEMASFLCLRGGWRMPHALQEETPSGSPYSSVLKIILECSNRLGDVVSMQTQMGDQAYSLSPGNDDSPLAEVAGKCG
jgi:hypothetical protein